MRCCLARQLAAKSAGNLGESFACQDTARNPAFIPGKPYFADRLLRKNLVVVNRREVARAPDALYESRAQ